MEDQIIALKDYLKIDGYFSACGIKSVKDVVIKRFENSVKTDFYSDFINWSKANNQILIGTYHAPEDMSLFESFDCIFNTRNPDEFVFQRGKLIHSLWNGWIPEKSIIRGHNHVITLEFENEIPEIFYRLFEENQYRPMAPNDTIILGLCCKNDFPVISNNLKKHLDKKSDL